MCLAIPGKIEKINKPLAIVNFQGLKKEINISLVEVKKGDYVMVHAGFAIEKMDKDYADEMNDYLKKNGKLLKK
jgi:hydrogenase expression/formation protein HypC